MTLQLPEIIWRDVETVGWAYETWVQENYGLEAEELEVEEEEEEIEIIDVSKLIPSVNLLKIKTADWKTNDHYAILGLQDIRYKATNKQLKAVHKALVLKYHPDKLGRAATKKDEEAFACITKSADILGDPIKRRNYDSIDPEFDNTIPKGDCKVLMKDFYNIFRPVFETNSRWALVRSKVLHLGDETTPRETVERFYNYWYEFKSWRDYGWEDEEDPEQAQDRYERRAIEKFNRVGRIKKKKEEMARIRKLVDLAWDSDPRIKAFEDEDKRKKEEAKQKKKDEARKYREDRMRQQIEESLAKAKAEADEKARLDEIEAERKKAAKSEKNATKKERKAFREIAKADDYWVEDDLQIAMMESVEFLCTAFGSIKLKELNATLAAASVDDRPVIVNESVDAHKRGEVADYKLATAKQAVVKAEASVVSGGWTTDDVKLLTKAMVTIPCGTLNRWDVIAIWMSDHGTSKERDSKTILKKAKELEKTSHKGPLDAQEAFKRFQEEQEKKSMEGKKNCAGDAEASENFLVNERENIEETQENGEAQETEEPQESEEPQENKPKPVENSRPKFVKSAKKDKKAKKEVAKPEAHAVVNAEWGQDEQKRLEQALRTYDPKEPERWDKIASAVDTRSKRECMVRFKQLAEMAKAKKLAIAKAKKAAN